MTWIVTWHDGGGSMVESADPRRIWTFSTEAEADALDAALGNLIMGNQGAFSDCWTQCLELPPATQANPIDLTQAFLQEQYEDEYEDMKDKMAWEAHVVALTAKGHWFVFEDTDISDPPEIRKPEMFGWEKRFAHAGSSVLVVHLDVDPKTGIGKTQRPASLWVDGVMLEGSNPIDIVKRFTAGLSGNHAIIEAATPEDMGMKIAEARRKFKLDKIEPLAEVPDDILESLGAWPKEKK